jgi:hypothetical protein
LPAKPRLPGRRVEAENLRSGLGNFSWFAGRSQSGHVPEGCGEHETNNRSGYLVDDPARASCNNKLAEFNRVALLRTDMGDRSEIHGMRWDNIEHAALLH